MTMGTGDVLSNQALLRARGTLPTAHSKRSPGADSGAPLRWELPGSLAGPTPGRARRPATQRSRACAHCWASRGQAARAGLQGSARGSTPEPVPALRAPGPRTSVWPCSVSEAAFLVDLSGTSLLRGNQRFQNPPGAGGGGCCSRASDAPVSDPCPPHSRAPQTGEGDTAVRSGDRGHGTVRTSDSMAGHSVFLRDFRDPVVLRFRFPCCCVCEQGSSSPVPPTRLLEGGPLPQQC